MTTTNIYTCSPDELAADYYVLTDAVVTQLTTPSARGNPIARAKPKAVAAASYLWAVGSGLKGTSRAHIDRLHSLGIGWKAIYEAGSADSDAGVAAGTLAARRALDYLLKVAPDYPHGLSITFCSDTDTTKFDLKANLDFHAAASQVLAEDGRWTASAYGDADLGEALPVDKTITYWGAMGSQKDFAAAILGVDRGSTKAMTSALTARKMRVPDSLQQGNGPGKLVDWLFIYTARLQVWLPGAGDVLGPPRTPHTMNLLPLKKGSTGNDVAWIQTILKHLCGRPNLVVDGIFGDQTEQAVRDFQTFCHLTVDGIVGPIETWPMFIHIVSK